MALSRAATGINLQAMSPSVRVYVNGEPLDVAPAATAMDAVTQWDPATAAHIQTGSHVIVDNRGLPIADDSPVFAGAIFRVVSARQKRPSGGDQPS